MFLVFSFIGYLKVFTFYWKTSLKAGESYEKRIERLVTSSGKEKKIDVDSKKLFAYENK